MTLTPYHQTARATVYHGDCLDVLRELPDNSVHAVVTDPPYGLEFMGKEWDSFKPSGARIRQPSARDTAPGAAHNSTTFLASRNKPDAYVAGRAFQDWCELWAVECLRVLKPGGHLLAFGGTRTWHRLTVAIEDAGFEIRDSIAWLYGSGFPKSLDVSKAIDKAAGAQREVIGPKRGPDGQSFASMRHKKPGTQHEGWESAWQHDPARVEAMNMETVPATPAAQQWSGWGTALKPSHEPVICARKPLAGTVAANVLAHGTGALNIDGCRVATDELKPYAPGLHRDSPSSFNDDGWRGREQAKPAPAGRWPANVVLDGSQAAALDQQSGTTRDGIATNRRRDPNQLASEAGWGYRKQTEDVGYAGEGGASRFFPVFRYEPKAPTRQRPQTDNGQAHATVKPVDLIRWLIRLITPPGGTVLDPFAGTGTTGEAATLEGFNSILIEREADYLPLIVARLHPHKPRRRPAPNPGAAATQPDLFDLLDGNPA